MTEHKQHQSITSPEDREWVVTIEYIQTVTNTMAATTSHFVEERDLQGFLHTVTEGSLLITGVRYSRHTHDVMIYVKRNRGRVVP